MSEPVRLYSINEIASMLGVSRKWVHNRLVKNASEAPPAEFCAQYGGKDPMLLWSESSLGRWQAFYASVESIPCNGRFFAYSDHQAVNTFRGTQVSWKLWSKAVPDGKIEWWFSTPRGWWTSDDEGVTWKDTGLLVRPTDFRYFCVNGNTKPSSATAAVLRRALELRHRLDVNNYDKVEG